MATNWTRLSDDAAKYAGTVDDRARRELDPALACSADELEKNAKDFRALFVSLSEAHPDWKTRRVTDYMYAHCDDFAKFFDKQPTFCDEILCTKFTYDQTEVDRLVFVLRQKEEAKIGHAEAMQILDGRHMRRGEEQKTLQNLVGDDPESFIAKHDPALKKRRGKLTKYINRRKVNKAGGP